MIKDGVFPSNTYVRLSARPGVADDRLYIAACDTRLPDGTSSTSFDYLYTNGTNVHDAFVDKDSDAVEILKTLLEFTRDYRRARMTEQYFNDTINKAADIIRYANEYCEALKTRPMFMDIYSGWDMIMARVEQP